MYLILSRTQEFSYAAKLMALQGCRIRGSSTSPALRHPNIQIPLSSCASASSAMPGRRDVAPVDSSLCRRCQINEPIINVRTEPLCRACFCRYVSTKAIKRMETFRVRHSDPGRERLLLLPLSFGACSTALLYILSEHLKGQVEKTGRTGFKLHVLHVDDASVPATISASEERLEKFKQRFPEHTYSLAPLSDITSDETVSSLFTADSPVLDKTSSEIETPQSIEQILSSLTSATSRADALQILRRKLIIKRAKQHNCESILWADSTTRLAERTLAETAKGRGFSLPSIVSDGESAYGIPFYYPMRELLSKEISAYTSLVDPPLDDLVVVRDEAKPAVSTKNTSIDDLMRQYFESVERDYPSIVANVVRTTGKLQAPSLSEVELRCELCEMPLEGGAPERSRLCYGCIRTLPRVAD